MSPVRLLCALLAAFVCLPSLPGPALTRASARTAAPAGLRIVGPAGEDPPVVNERRKLKLRVVDAANQGVRVAKWSSLDVRTATVTPKGALKGVSYGFATITARTKGGDTVS